MSEWGNPAGGDTGHRLMPGRTRGSETSQYPEEKKSNEIPRVAASEMGVARLGVASLLGEVYGKTHQRG